MAKTKTKQSGEIIKGLSADAGINSNLIDHDLASVNLNAYSPNNPIDYQFEPLDVPEQLIVDNTLQNLAVVVNDPVVVDPYPVIIDPPPVVVNPPIIGVVLIGTDGEEMIVGTDGNDIIDGKAGIDILMGGAGNDILSSSGSSWLYGDSGKDTFNLTGGWHVIADWNSAEDTLNVSFGSRVSVVTHLSSNDFTLTTAQNISVENANNAGTIFLSGYYSNDRLTGSAGVDILYGDSGDNVLIGNAGNDNLDGGQGNDTLLGGAGDDTLNGGDGNDTLTGGAGSDTFTLFGNNQVDRLGITTITDFVSGFDKIMLINSDIYNYNNPRSSFLADELVQGAGAVALDANDHFIFDSTTGVLSYDSDGNGAAEAVQFATLQGVTQLSIEDFTLLQLPQITLSTPMFEPLPGCFGYDYPTQITPLEPPLITAGDVSLVGVSTLTSPEAV